jgi:hypothetical protein
VERAEPASATAPGAGHAAASSSRRTLLKLGGAAAVAGVAAVAVGATELAHPGIAHAHSDLTGVLGTQSGAGNVGVEGDGTSSAVGVKGTSLGSIGVWGTSDVSFAMLAQSTGGVGLRATSTNGNAIETLSTNNIGVVGNSTHNYGGTFQGGLAPLLLTPSTSPTAGPPSGTHQKGELYVDILGVLWYCFSNAPGPSSWIRVAGTQGSTPGGVLNYLPAPIRLFDSRPGGAPLPTTKAPLNGGTVTFIQVPGNDVGGISVPAGALGIFGNLTVTNTQGGGDLILWPDGATQPTTSNINYSGGQTVANSFNVGLSSNGAMDLFVHVSGTDVIIDIAGYVM